MSASAGEVTDGPGSSRVTSSPSRCVRVATAAPAPVRPQNSVWAPDMRVHGRGWRWTTSRRTGDRDLTLICSRDLVAGSPELVDLWVSREEAPDNRRDEERSPPFPRQHTRDSAAKNTRSEGIRRGRG